MGHLERAQSLEKILCLARASGFVMSVSLANCLNLQSMCFSVASVIPSALNVISVLMSVASVLGGIRFISLANRPFTRARSLVWIPVSDTVLWVSWIRTLACGAGDPGFKSLRAR